MLYPSHFIHTSLGTAYPGFVFLPQCIGFFLGSDLIHDKLGCLLASRRLDDLTKCLNILKVIRHGSIW